MIFSNRPTAWIILLALHFRTAQASFRPWLGCDDTFASGVPRSDDECYAVDSSICKWWYDTGCREETARYSYYNGGRDGFPYLRYHTISIRASHNCSEDGDGPIRSCSVQVDGEECNACTNTDKENYRIITLENCSNLEGTFPPEPQTLIVAEKQGHLELALNETMCSHPALVGEETASPTLVVTEPYGTYLPDVWSSNPTTEGPSTTSAPTSLRGSAAPTPAPTNAPRIPKSNSTASTDLRVGNDDPQKKPPTTKTLVLHPKLKLSLPFGSSTLPQQSTLASLIEDTNGFFRDLLQEQIPLLQEYSMSKLTTELLPRGLFLNFTATLTLDASSPTTTRQVATVLSSNRHLNDYLRQAVKPLFPQIRQVRAWVVASGVAVVGERD